MSSNKIIGVWGPSTLWSKPLDFRGESRANRFGRNSAGAHMWIKHLLRASGHDARKAINLPFRHKIECVRQAKSIIIHTSWQRYLCALSKLEIAMFGQMWGCSLHQYIVKDQTAASHLAKHRYFDFTQSTKVPLPWGMNYYWFFFVLWVNWK